MCCMDLMMSRVSEKQFSYLPININQQIFAPINLIDANNFWRDNDFTWVYMLN